MCAEQPNRPTGTAMKIDDQALNEVSQYKRPKAKRFLRMVTEMELSFLKERQRLVEAAKT
jgi:hypothetical protein